VSTVSLPDRRARFVRFLRAQSRHRHRLCNPVRSKALVDQMEPVVVVMLDDSVGKIDITKSCEESSKKYRDMRRRFSRVCTRWAVNQLGVCHLGH